MGDHDYIRRILAKAQFTGNFQDEYPTALIHALIDDVPAEDVQPVVHGRWIQDCDYHFRCSICGDRWIVSDGNPLDVANGWRFCPYCGARMDLEAETDV